MSMKVLGGDQGDIVEADWRSVGVVDEHDRDLHAGQSVRQTCLWSQGTQRRRCGRARLRAWASSQVGRARYLQVAGMYRLPLQVSPMNRLVRLFVAVLSRFLIVPCTSVQIM